MAASKRNSTNTKMQYQIQKCNAVASTFLWKFGYVCMVVFEKFTSKLFFSSLSKYKTADYVITEALIYCYWDPKNNVSTRQDSRFRFLFTQVNFLYIMNRRWMLCLKYNLIEKECTQDKTPLGQACLISCYSFLQ